MKNYQIPPLPLSIDLESRDILRQLNHANRKLAELKGLVRNIPNEAILIHSLTLQEAKDSSAVENIVTTNDDLYKSELNVSDFIASAAAKEVMNYRQALNIGYQRVRQDKLLTNNIILEVQQALVGNTAGFRKVPGTVLKDARGNIVYTPPQDGHVIEELMTDLERFINNPDLCDLDPLIKLAVIHHQFESIHPFYDGNGRTGRIISILYLVLNGLLDLPILYLSRYIISNKSEYYRLLQVIREQENNTAAWHEWVLFNLKGVEEIAGSTLILVQQILELMQAYKQTLRPLFGKNYKHDLLNHLFYHPYTKIEFMEQAMQVRRKTAAKYLQMMVEAGLLLKVKVGRSNYFINQKLVELLMDNRDNSTNGQVSGK
jgi:Fic family protein